jgi:asparagine synthase (glutamine-hydrolysing)
MCGFCGILSKNHQEVIGRATQLIAHRGPDDMGIFHGDGISLGHRRLAIQDLSENGHQPMFDKTGRYAMVYNGEVYNHFEIREDLKNEFEFKSTSDSETLLYGFIKYGTALFNKLNGIFSIAYYDLEKGEVTVVRDQFGVKPMYYSSGSDFFYFASESKAFVHLPEVDKTPDIEAIGNYLNFLWSPGEPTAVKGVKKLLPGHYIKVSVSDFQQNRGAVVPVQYYEIPFNQERIQATEAELIDALEVHLSKAVERQLLSDVPVGFFLSGGLDSSAIVAMAKKVMPNERLKCYTIDYGDADADGVETDLDYAKQVALHLDVDLEIVQGTKDILAEYESMIYHLDEPQTDIAPIHVRNICRAARADGRVVLLGGTAGDDLFSGYRRHQVLPLEKMIDYIPQPIRYLAQKCAAPIAKGNSAMHRRVAKALRNVHLKGLERMAAYFSWLELDTIKGLFAPKFQKQLASFNPSDTLIASLKQIPNEKERLNQMLFWELKYFLVDHNLNYTDKLGMAEGVEIRVPFLDKELLEFSTKLPIEFKLKGKTTKYLLKKLMERYLPHEVIYRSKSGFGGPVRQWINHEKIDWVNQKLSKEEIDRLGMFDYTAVKNLIEQSRVGSMDGAYSVLSLIGIHSYFIQIANPMHEPKATV